MFNKKYKKDCNVDVGEKSGDIATNNLSKYVTDNNVDLNEICKETGIEYDCLNKSINLGNRNLETDEFLEICNYLNKDPKNFK